MSLENLTPEARDELASLAQTLADNPDTRKDFLRMTKRVKPGLTIPELDIEDNTNRSIAQIRAENEQLKAKFQERDALDNLDKRRKVLLKKGLVNSEAEIDTVEKIMLEKGINNHESAAEYMRWMQQAATPTPSGYNPSAIRKFDLGKYWKDPKGAAQQEAMAALKELRQPTRPIGLA